MAGTPAAGSGRRSALGVAVAYHVAMGVLGLALAAWFVLSLVETVAAGYCDMFEGAVVCGHSAQDLVAPSIAAIVAVTLLPTAWLLRRDPPRVGLLTGVGAAVGVLIALLPIVLIVLASDPDGTLNIFGAKTPVLALVAIFALPLLWALVGAYAVWREAARQGKLPVHLLAAGAATLAFVVGMLALGTSRGTQEEVGADLVQSTGRATLRLARPTEVVDEDEVLCTHGPGGEVQVHLDGLDEQPEPGRPAHDVIVTVGARLGIGLNPRDDGLEVLIEVHHAEREPDQVSSTPESRLELERDGPSGTIRFADLAATSFGDDGPAEVPSDLEGTFEWSCSEP